VRIAAPTVAQVDELDALIEIAVPPDWEDINGHVNVRHYLDLYNEAGGPMLQRLGVDETYFRSARRGFFDLEHHLWYLAEMHVGDRVTVHVRYLARSAKRFHGTMFVVNRTRDSVASVLEFLASGADLRTRRTAEFPAAVRARLDALLEEHGRLSWRAPVCGSIAP
jgi:acyl-CoA thioester hydrolase